MHYVSEQGIHLHKDPTERGKQKEEVSRRYALKTFAPVNAHKVSLILPPLKCPPL